MARKSINLLIAKEEESLIYRRLKKFSPIVAAVVLSIFILTYILSIVYIRISLADYNTVKSQASLLERKISSEKSRESIYISTISVLQAINKIINNDTKIIVNTLPEINRIQNANAVISTASIDQSGQVSFFLTAENIEYLNNFVNNLKRMEQANSFNNIIASGIIRENDGRYTMTVSLKVNKKST